MVNRNPSHKIVSGTVWHVNSTATGGGVAELLRSTIKAHRRLGLSAQWHVIGGEANFFDITKTLHHQLHGSQSTINLTPQTQRQIYEATAAREAKILAQKLCPGDIVILHDPQTLGLAKYLVHTGVVMAWRLHIGTTKRNSEVSQAWDFLRPYLDQISYCVLSLDGFRPVWLEPNRTMVIPPAIDPDTDKNRYLNSNEVSDILAAIGLTDQHEVVRADKKFFPIKTISRVIQDAPLPKQAPIVVQISRWDPLKDMAGVLQAFVKYVAPHTDAHLVLAGPDPVDIPDDPEGAKVFAEITAARATLPQTDRSRIHLVVLSLEDTQANALAVNALQRSAHVIVQHSLREGFGLTVTEGMWKSRPIVASHIDGIARQITHGIHGLLTTDPSDLATLGKYIKKLLEKPALAAGLGTAARQRCEQEFLLPRETADYLALYAALRRKGSLSPVTPLHR